MLLAEVPEPTSSASDWHSHKGFHWRLHVRHRSRHTARLTLSLVRESIFSDVQIGIQLRLLSNNLRKPVRNITIPSKESFPHERNSVTLLPASLASKSLKLLPIAVPLTAFVVGISVEVRQCCFEMARRLGRAMESSSGSDTVERFWDPVVKGKSVEWVKEADYYPDAARSKMEKLRQTHDKTEIGGDSRTPPHSLGALLESCNFGGAGHEQSPDTSFSDVSLIAGSGSNSRTFNLHRCILALASPVFRAMLTSDMLERRTGTIILPNFSPSAVCLAIRHIYGFPVKVTQHAFELYHFAHQFDITSLLRAARRAIIRSLGLRSCVHIHRFGGVFRDDKIANIAQSFIAARFSEILGDDVAAKEMSHLPMETLVRLLDGDTIEATEQEILMFALRWLADNKEAESGDVLKRIRQGLLHPEILELLDRVGLITLAPSEQTNESMTISTEQKRATLCSSHQRWLGRPHAKFLVPLIRRPPSAFLYTSCLTKTSKRRKARPSSRDDSPQHNKTSFEHRNFKWSFQSMLENSNGTAVSRPRLSASLWLEEGDNGKAWNGGGEDLLPVRVSASLMVWNHLGGLLHVTSIDVVFRSAGWGNGWCVRDLMDGARHDLSKYRDAVTVAVEIRKISAV